MGVPNSFNDLTGKRFGRLTVVCRTENKGGRTNWHCNCDCGNEKDVLGINLTRGFTKSCGCLHKETTAKMGKRHFEDLSGKKFGMLSVLELSRIYDGRTYWNCRCDCGKTIEVNAAHLKRGVKTSCGCATVNRGNFKKGESRKKTHGMSNTRLYRIYKKMYRRCYCPQTKWYENYGGRGITICPEWLGEHGFENFAKWALDNGYANNLSIDRIDNGKGYSPDNCKWSTRKEQANNTRSTIFLTYKGETKPASEWSEITGIRQDTLTYRKRNGWTDEECIETPLSKNRGRRKSNTD